MRRITLISENYPNQLLLIANFSGFLTSKGNLNKAKQPFDELLGYASTTGAIGVWIEPMINKATHQGGLFGWLSEKILKPSQSFVKCLLDENCMSGEIHVFRALAPQERVRVTLAINVFELGRFK